MRWLLLLVMLLPACTARRAVTDVGPAASPAAIELRNLSAGPFDPAAWQRGTLHFLPDTRSPLIDPLPGAFRNIYAPSVVALPDRSFRIFYGAWDGTPTGNDRIYSLVTDPDFLTFRDRRTVIEHGPFQHVCNVSAVANPDHSFTLMCTAYPDAAGLNKPAQFHLPADGPPVVAQKDNLITIDGYPNYAAGDFNGMNPVHRSPAGYHLYFADFKNFGHIYRATSPDARHFTLDAKVLDFPGMPNDERRLGNHTLLALHHNGPTLFYTLSTNPLSFPAPQELGRHLGPDDRYIVAVGLVTTPDDRVLGYLYGAGAAPSLDKNRIFARWLQRKVTFLTDDGRELTATRALGPDRALLEIPAAATGVLRLYAEDGLTPIWQSPRLSLTPGRAYQIPR